VAKSASVTVEFDMTALQDAASHDSLVESMLRVRTAQCVNAANAMSSGFRTGIYHRDHRSPGVGNTQPVYVGDVTEGRRGIVGIVHPANYAAMLDNHENNTLLKVKG
jgi:hypothetical protein